MSREISATLTCGFQITANSEGHIGYPEVPDGFFAAVVTANDAWFVIDVAGNVRGDPESVEREALAQGIDQNLIAAGVVGIARLARRKVLLGSC